MSKTNHEIQNPYAQILHATRPKSQHPAMPRDARAAQFMPFAALEGFQEKSPVGSPTGDKG